MRLTERAEQLENRVLLVAPAGQEVELIRRLLTDAEFDLFVCENLGQAAREADRGAAVVVLTGDFAAYADPAPFLYFLQTQPEWSELPVIMPVDSGAPADVTRLLSTVNGAVLLERPVFTQALVGAVLAAARARRRQYQVRLQLDEVGRERRQPVHSDRWFGAAIEAGQFGAFQRDLSTGRIETSPTFRQIYGLNNDEPFEYGRLEQLVNPEDLGRMRKAIATAVSGEDMYRTEYRIRTPAGDERWVMVRGHILVSDPGQPPRLVGVALNVTDQKRAEEERERLLARERDAHAQSEQSNRAKDQFLAVLSHELRTPLTPVLATAQAMADDPTLSGDVRDAFDMVRRNVELEARLIDDLLDLTRIDRGKLEIQPVTVDLHVEIARVAAIVDSDLRAKQLSFVTELGASPSYVHADPVRLQQVLWNLLKNAIKFTPEGGTVTLRTRSQRRPLPAKRTRSDSQGPDGHAAAADRIVIEVQDTGVGIPADVLPRLFNAFEQGSRETTRLFGGLGLGLTISKALVEAHGGTISVRSEGTNRGSTFTVDFPAVPVAVRDGAMFAGDGPRTGDVRPAVGRKILLVEDHVDTARAMARILTGRGHMVRTADTVASALRAVMSEHYDLVISDIGLPDGSGLDLMRQIVSRVGRMPAIALSGFGMEEDIRRSRAAGFSAHLTKPVNLDSLDAAVRQVAARAADARATSS